MFRPFRIRWTRALACVLILGLISACAPAGDQSGRPPTGLNSRLLLVEVYPNGWAPDGSDQYVRLHNPFVNPVEVSNWTIGDLVVRARFPEGATIASGQSIYVARYVNGFRNLMGAPPDYVWGTEEAGATIRRLTGGELWSLGRDSGYISLMNAAGEAVDSVAFGQTLQPGARGWRGSPAPVPLKGEVLDRARDEASWTAEQPGNYTRDTDSAKDWQQGNAWMDLRIYRPGQTWFSYPTYQVGEVTAYASPDNSYAVVTRAIEQARERIDMVLYDFTLVPVAERLAAAARRGIKVRLQLEAGSFNRLYDQERYVAKLVEEAGGEVRWQVHDPNNQAFGRYVFNHAKYGIIDGKTAFVQSENMVRHGVPVDPTYGNRGWGALVEDRYLAAYLTRVFEADWTTVFGDSLPYQPGTQLGPPPDDFVPETGTLKGKYPHPFPPLTVRGPVSITPVLAPDHSLLETKGVIGLMRKARESLLIEQQYIHMNCA